MDHDALTVVTAVCPEAAAVIVGEDVEVFVIVFFRESAGDHQGVAVACGARWNPFGNRLDQSLPDQIVSVPARPDQEDPRWRDGIEYRPLWRGHMHGDEVTGIRRLVWGRDRFEGGIGRRDADSKGAIDRSFDLFVASGVVDQERVLGYRDPHLHLYRFVGDHVVVEEVLCAPGSPWKPPEGPPRDRFAVRDYFVHTIVECLHPVLFDEGEVPFDARLHGADLGVDVSHVPLWGAAVEFYDPHYLVVDLAPLD